MLYTNQFTSFPDPSYYTPLLLRLRSILMTDPHESSLHSPVHVDGPYPSPYFFAYLYQRQYWTYNNEPTSHMTYQTHPPHPHHPSVLPGRSNTLQLSYTH